tara:strand:- start:12963 stop:13538 length:576 start_codon:yes stop_codon:yes gene_type:complete
MVMIQCEALLKSYPSIGIQSVRYGLKLDSSKSLVLMEDFFEFLNKAGENRNSLEGIAFLSGKEEVIRAYSKSEFTINKLVLNLFNKKGLATYLRNERIYENECSIDCYIGMVRDITEDSVKEELIVFDTFEDILDDMSTARKIAYLDTELEIPEEEQKFWIRIFGEGYVSRYDDKFEKNFMVVLDEYESLC